MKRLIFEIQNQEYDEDSHDVLVLTGGGMPHIHATGEQLSAEGFALAMALAAASDDEAEQKRLQTESPSGSDPELLPILSTYALQILIEVVEQLVRGLEQLGQRSIRAQFAQQAAAAANQAEAVMNRTTIPEQEI